MMSEPAYNLYSFINYELSTTLTVVDYNLQSNYLINLFYKRSPHRICSNVMKKLNQSAKDRLDKFPTCHLDKLNFKHIIYKINYEDRLKAYWDKLIDSSTTIIKTIPAEDTEKRIAYTITRDGFPARYIKGYDDFLKFVSSCEPTNLNLALIPYEHIADFSYSVEQNNFAECIRELCIEWSLPYEHSSLPSSFL
jgi:hypothetical protein